MVIFGGVFIYIFDMFLRKSPPLHLDKGDVSIFWDASHIIDFYTKMLQ
jgi:hypothetical protein